MAINGFSHLGICVSDLDRSLAFYRDVLGFRTVYRMDFTGDEVAATMEQSGPFTSAMLARDDLRIELLHWHDLTPGGTGERRPMTQLGITHLSFRVDDVDELSEAVEAAGGAVHRQTLTVLGDPGGPDAPVRFLYLTDPDGTRIEVMENVPAL